MPSEQYQRFVELLEGARVTPDLPVESAREAYAAATSVIPLADGARTREVILGGVPTEEVTAPDVADDRALVWFHGGGYVIGGPASHRPLASRLSAATGAPVLVVDYRLAPEHRHPAATDDADGGAGGGTGGTDPVGSSSAATPPVAVWRWPRSSPVATPVAPSRWRWGWCRRGSTSPAPAPPWRDNAASDLILPRAARALGGLHRHGADATEALVSPLYADLDGLPPVLVQASATEILADDARRLAERGTEAGTRRAPRAGRRPRAPLAPVGRAVPRGRRGRRASRWPAARTHLDAAPGRGRSSCTVGRSSPSSWSRLPTTSRWRRPPSTRRPAPRPPRHEPP
ncbi:MAG: alpha/beta hydrolase fold domain-containing protein [Acidimicrobiia bacterium]|nr:alpha/beta hydrolase fold domain-containing protein [Acidimicrobiia bacterium]